MTPLRKRMQEELQRRNYSEMTAICYVRHVAEFAKFFRRSPDSLGAEEIKQYQLHLIHDKKVSWSTYIQATAALRFLYIKTRGQAFMAEKIPFPKRPKFLPTVLAQDEVRRLLDATTSLKHRALFMTLYGGGLRVSEACNLAVTDIDSSPHGHPCPTSQRTQRSRCHAFTGAAGCASAVLQTQPPQRLAVSRKERRQADHDQSRIPHDSEIGCPCEDYQDRLPACAAAQFCDPSAGVRYGRAYHPTATGA